MKNTIHLAVLLSVMAGTAFTSSCKSDPAPIKSKTELLTVAPWKRTALISNPAHDWNADGTFATDILTTMWPCERDNLDIYRTNGIVETDEGPTKCNPTDSQSWTASWAFKDNETKIVINGTDEYTIDELTATTLKLQSTFVENGVTYTHYESYGH